MLRVLLCALLVAAGAADYQFSLSGRPQKAQTKEGLVRGWTAKSAAGKQYVSFKGIPYARPPVGELRFQPSQRHPGWRTTLDASQHGSVCPQIDPYGEVPLVGDEDCLFVNVYTRKVWTWSEDPRRLPVMVFIHGGSFIRGSGDDRYYGPSYLMDDDIVLVTFNYRLGPFGFLTTHDTSAPGNYGLRDQVMLLQWVQDNIASFGGDPKAVTIFGESAGAASVSLLVLSPLAKGLFHHAISQSGTAIANFAASGRRMGFTEKLAKKFSCPTHTTEAIVACLRLVPAQELLVTARPDQHLYQPRVDSEVKHPLLPEDPRLLLERGDFNLVPWMHGNTKEEGWFFVPIFAANPTILGGILAGNPIVWGLLADLTTRTASNILDCGADPTEETLKVREFYSEQGTPESITLLPAARVLSDRFFNAPMSVETSLASRYTPVYRYVFEYKGPDRLFFGNISALNVPDTDPGHGDDLMYLFSQTERPLEKPGTPNHGMIRNMVSLWTSFARTGRPSSGSPAAPDWPILTEHGQQHMRLDSELTLGTRLFEERVNFWQTVAINEPWRHPVVPFCPKGRLGGDSSEPESGDQTLYSALLTKFN